MKKILPSAAFFASILPAFTASAETVYEGMAKPWQLGFQPAATPVMERLNTTHDYLLVIITAITLLVLVLMVYICLRFRRSANPVPSKTTHNTRLEIIWTALPILILVAIAIPSLRLHYFMQHVVEPDMTLKVVGYQWYWHYEYPDQGGFGFDSYLKKGKDVGEGEHRLLAVDNHVVVPVGAKVRVLITGADVIHSWAVPAFGVKRDGVPGRLNESWFEATQIGRFYGQCSELCGVGHGFMPIVVDVVSKEDFETWVKGKQKEAGITAPAAVPAAAPTPVSAHETPLVKPQPNAADTKPQTADDKNSVKPAKPIKTQQEEAAEPEEDAAPAHTDNNASDKESGDDQQ